MRYVKRHCFILFLFVAAFSYLLISASAATQKAITYSGFRTAEGKAYHGDATLLDGKSFDGEIIVTKEGKLLAGNGSEVLSESRIDLKNGCVSYAVSKRNISLQEVQVVMPAFYAKNAAKPRKVDFYQNVYNDYTFSVYERENIETGNGDDSSVVIRCDLPNGNTFPYDCSMEIDGVNYTPATYDVYFCEETGEASRVYMTFNDLTPSEICGNVYMNIDSIMEMYVASEFSLSN